MKRQIVKDVVPHLKGLMAHCAHSVFVVQLPSWKIIDSNARAAELVSKSTAQLMSSSFLDFLDERNAEGLHQAYLKAAESKLPVSTFSAPFLTSANSTTNGTSISSIIDLEIHYEYGDAETRGIILAIPVLSAVGDKDTSSLFESKSAHSQFHFLLDIMPIGILLSNPQGEILYINSIMEDLTGLTEQTLLGRNWLNTVHPEDLEAVENEWQKCLRENISFKKEYRVVTSDNTIRWVAGESISYHDESGHNTDRLGTLTDITDQKQADMDIRSGEDKYQRIFENILDVYYETTMEGEILELSPSVNQLTDIPREELLGRNISDFYASEEDRSHLLAELQDNGYVSQYDIQLQLEDSAISLYSITARLVRDGNGIPVKIVGMLRDAIERQYADRLQQIQRENLEAIAKGIPLEEALTKHIHNIESLSEGRYCAVHILDDSGVRLQVSAAPNFPRDLIRVIDGIPILEGYGSCGSAAYKREPVYISDVTAPLYENMCREIIQHCDIRSCWSMPILSSNGMLLGTFSMYGETPGMPDKRQLQLLSTATYLASIALERHTISNERNILERQMQHTQKLESLGILAGGIAHDFNNLLTAILGYATLMSQALDSDPDAVKVYLKEIESITSRATNLTQQMLAYSGKSTQEHCAIDLTAEVSELAQLLHISISKKACLNYKFDQDLPLIHGDTSQIQQVIMNLITNASEALDDKSGDIKIRTGRINASASDLNQSLTEIVVEPGPYVFVEVSDTGCGMDTKTRQRIFDPFYTTKKAGRGLGLSAILGIVRSHNGAILLKSEPGVGSSFSAFFPEHNAQSLSPTVDALPSSPLEKHAEGQIILVVDDEEMIRKIATMILESSGYRVLQASDGMEGAHQFAQNPDIAAVLLDLTMPKQDGLETLTAIREIDSHVPVIITSGYSEEEVAERVPLHLKYTFIQKPYMRHTLIEIIYSSMGSEQVQLHTNQAP